MDPNFEEALDKFVASCQTKITDYYTDNLSNIPKDRIPRLEAVEGKRYVKIVSEL